MDFIDKLSSVASFHELNKLIQNDYQTAYDFFLVQNNSSINEHQLRIEQVISSKIDLIRELDFSYATNRNFLIVLTLGCERIGAFSIFEHLYKLCSESGADISYRLQAIAKYTIGIRRFDDYFNAFDEILLKLNNAFEKEEDNIEIVVAAFIQYYAKVINNFGRFYQKGVLSIKDRIIQNRESNYLLQHPIIDEILQINTIDFKLAFEQIQLLLDNLLKRSIKISNTINTDLLIEIESEYNYASLLTNTEKTFNSIRNLSVLICEKFDNQMIYDSLGRGTSILNAESQLYAYFKSFGNAHCAKMLNALSKISFDDINKNVEIFDWGCGQGLASIVLLENSNKINITSITLIEPSEIALKRASLHIKHMNNLTKIKTVCKRIDVLEDSDVFSELTNIKIHLFSNILDVDGFSITNLAGLIENTQKGINYFICVSPYIDDFKSDRVDSFNRYFQNKYNSFTSLGSETNSKFDDKYWNCNNNYNGNFNGRFCPTSHPINGCYKQWTRVIRVFRVEI